MDDEKTLPKLDIRCAIPEDDEFLFRVYAETRAEEFAVLGWESAQLDAFLKTQFTMRRLSYSIQSPGAETFIAEADGRPAATFITHRRDRAIELVDIAVSSDMRKHGIATEIIELLMAERLPIELNVEVMNEFAIALYGKLGFRETESGDVYKKMRWTPSEQ